MKFIRPYQHNPLKEKKMLKESPEILTVSTTKDQCPIGETVGHQNQTRAKIPVLSCEGACIRGEIARQAANLVAKHDGFARACHGELLTVPGSSIAQWVKTAKKVVLIDGCFLRCHGRILENLLTEDQLVQFDALSYYKKYTQVFDPDDVPETERLEVAHRVAQWIVAGIATERGESCPISGCSVDSGCCQSHEKNLCEAKKRLAGARQFVAAMRENECLRRHIRKAATQGELSDILEQNGFAFELHHFVDAMADCMEESEQSPCAVSYPD
jgi:uncharacterized metal-binding protein